ncbi:MAG: hypothetical protein K6U74_04325 [Firmicutes bacterium]|nr:hypothetical protein [Bacillota bacterium]
MLIYVMAPKTIYNDGEYLKKTEFLKEKYPDWDFLFCHTLFKSNDHWLETIDGIIDRVDGGILITDKGIIGRGCWVEINKLIEKGKPVYCLDGENLLDAFAISKLPGDDWVNYARVFVPGYKMGGGFEWRAMSVSAPGADAS